MITETTEWQQATSSGLGNAGGIAAVAARVILSDVTTLIGLVRGAPPATGALAHAVLRQVKEVGALQLTVDELDSWTEALLERNAGVVAEWRRNPSDGSLHAFYEAVMTTMFEGASYRLLVERLGAPQVLSPELRGVRGPSCHYASEHLDLYLESDTAGRLVGWKQVEDRGRRTRG